MCTWCPASVVCDLSIRECVSELGMYPCCRWALTVGGVVRVRGPCWSPPFVHMLLLYHYYYFYILMGRYGRVYRLWASASSGAYRRVMQVAGPCDVYRTVFWPTLRSLNVCTFSARVPPPPSQLLYCVGLSILAAVSL